MMYAHRQMDFNNIICRKAYIIVPYILPLLLKF